MSVDQGFDSKRSVIPKDQKSNGERKHVFLMPTVRIFRFGINKACVYCQGLFQGDLKEEFDNFAYKQEKLMIEHLLLQKKNKELSLEERILAADQAMERLSRLGSNGNCTKKIPTNLAPTEVLERQSQAFYFSGNKLQHTEEEGDNFINLTEKDDLRLLNDFSNGITLAEIDNNSLYASIPEETQPFDLAVAICNLVRFCNQSNLSPSQILKAAKQLEDSLISFCFDTRKKGIFRREYSFNKERFNKFQSDILDQARNVLNGVKTGVYI